MRVAGNDAMTYVPREDEAAELSELLLKLQPGPGAVPRLIDADGVTIHLNETVYEALLAAVRAMAAGEGISIVPRSKQLTTQESADLLGVSRPTLVSMLERGDISFTKVGRHRKVRLSDLLDYRDTATKNRADALDEMAAEGQRSGAYDKTAGPPPAMR